MPWAEAMRAGLMFVAFGASLDAATREEIAAAIAKVAADGAACVLLATGVGEEALTASADISAMRDLTVEPARERSGVGMRVMHALPFHYSKQGDTASGT